MRIIGDVHGKFNQYCELISNSSYSIQVGDFGFESWNDLEKSSISPDYHKVIPGNHDNYNILISNPHNMGNYGYRVFNGFLFFFVRGAGSIDKNLRIPGISWWENEELSYIQLNASISLYDKIKPKIVLSHTAPVSVSKKMFGVEDKCRTSRALQTMYECHRPELWIFGHWHILKTKKISDTTFTCLGELDYIDIN